MSQAASAIKLTVDLQGGLQSDPPKLAEQTLRANWREFVSLPVLLPRMVTRAKQAALDIQDKIKKKELPSLSIDLIKNRLDQNGYPLQHCSPQFLAVVLSELVFVDKFQVYIQKMHKQIKSAADSGSEVDSQIRRSIIRYSLEQNFLESSFTLAALEKFNDPTSFARRFQIQELLHKVSARELVVLAYPNLSTQDQTLVRLELIENKQVKTNRRIDFDKPILAVSALLLEVGALTKGGPDEAYKINKDVFRSTDWGVLFKKRGLAHFLSSHPQIAGDSLKALELAAESLGVTDLFGAGPEQVPPYYITRIDLWKSQYKDRPMTWYLGKSLISAIKHVYPECCYTEGEKLGELKPSSCGGVDWVTSSNKLADGVVNRKGVTVADLISFGDPHFFGLGKDQILPVELPFIGVQELADMRARLAVGFYRAGLGDIIYSKSEAKWSVTLEKFENWSQSLTPQFGQEFFKSMRGSLRKFKAESVSAGIGILVNGKAELPAEVSTVKRQELFKGTFKLLLSQLKETVLVIDLKFKKVLAAESESSATDTDTGGMGGQQPSVQVRTAESPKKESVASSPSAALDPNTLWVDSEEAELLYARYVMEKNEYPKPEQLLEFIKLTRKHDGPVKLDDSRLDFKPVIRIEEE